MSPQSFAIVYTGSLFAVDLLAGFVALVLAYEIRFHALPVTKGYDPADYLRMLPVAIVAWMAARFFSGLNRYRQRAFDLRVARRSAKASLLATLLIMAAAFFTHVDYSRTMPVLVAVCFFACHCLLRLGAEIFFGRLRRTTGLGQWRTAIIGTGLAMRKTADRILSDPVSGRKLVGFFTVGDDREIAPAAVDAPSTTLACLGDAAELDRLAREHDLEEIIVAAPNLTPQAVVEILLDAEKLCLRAAVVPNLLELVVTQDVHLEDVGGIPLLGLRGSRLRGGNLALKRLFDIVVGGTMLVGLAPVFGVIAILIRAGSPGPIFYTQQRVTLSGDAFNMIKFRSMRIDAEDKSGPVWAKSNDDRTTRVGRLLRRTNLDELPQLINVLRGEMSLVGPRPERPFFVDQFKDEIPNYMGRLRVKAGMTGWAQVHGLRGNTPLTERIRYDLYYVENWSIWFDIKILWLTLFSHENAY